ncbi:MAG: winged helix-turn-helix transcriptional regulator [Christensenellales bacterium]
MDLRSSSITADILNCLSDCKIHTIDEIANEVEVSRSTVKRHIQSLSYRYPIQTFCGGINRGGVYLDKNYINQGQILSNDELQIISKALILLQKNGSNVDKEILSSLIEKYSLPQLRRIEND